MQKGKIIMLNGVSSSGKSTLAKELERRLPGFFHLSIDDFDKVIDTMEDREAGRLIPVETEYFFHRIVAMFSDKGVNLIVDQILHDEFTTEDAIKTLGAHPVVFVGVHCPVEEIRRREETRGDRQVGQGNAQLAYVHRQGEVYDVEVNTSHESLDTCAERVMRALEHPTGWRSTCQSYLGGE